MHRLLFIVGMAFVSFALAGCSDLKFVNATNLGTEEADPREDVRLTGVVTDITTGGLVERRISSDAGVYSMARNFVELSEVKVESFDEKGGVEGMTSADRALVHLADKPDVKPPRSRNDIEFVGDVRHRIPAKDDPSTDAVNLQTERLEWDQKAQRFRAKTYYQMTMKQPNKPPLVTVGDEFAATRDLRSWVVAHGAITTRQGVDVRQEAARKRAEIGAILQNSEEGRGESPQAKPIDIPLEMQAAQQTPAIGTIDIPSTGAVEVVGNRKRYRMPGMVAPAPPPADRTPAPKASSPEPDEATPRPTRRPTATPLSRDVERAIGTDRR